MFTRNIELSIAASLSQSTAKRATTLMGALLLCACGASLTLQTHQFWQLLQPVAITPTKTERQTPVRLKHAEIAELFGKNSAANAPPTTPLHLTLLASFTHPDIARSSAIIGQPDEPARRIRVGESIRNGIVLSGVFPKHVTLTRNNRSEVLYFSETQRQTLASDSQTPLKRRTD